MTIIAKRSPLLPSGLLYDPANAEYWAYWRRYGEILKLHDMRCNKRRFTDINKKCTCGKDEK